MNEKQKDWSPLIGKKELQYLTEAYPPKKRVIVAAACTYTPPLEDDVPTILLVGARHWDSVMTMQRKALKTDYGSGHYDQGFIDQYGQYINRTDAKEIAIANGQPLIGEDYGKALYSENLY